MVTMQPKFKASSWNLQLLDLVSMCTVHRYFSTSEYLTPKLIRAGFTPVPSPKSLEVDPCNLNRREHGSSNLPLHTRSQVPSHSRSIHAISAVETMEVGTYHFTHGPKSQVTRGQSVQSQLLRAWKLGLTTSHGSQVLSPQVWHGCLHGNTFWRWGLGLVLRVWVKQKPRPNLQHNPTQIQTMF